MNLVGISMKKSILDLVLCCLILLFAHVLDLHDMVRVCARHVCRILVISCRRFLLVALVLWGFFIRILLQPQDCRPRSSNHAELLVAFGSCRPLLRFGYQHLFLFFDLFWSGHVSRIPFGLLFIQDCAQGVLFLLR
jgi:hypothetical protein